MGQVNKPYDVAILSEPNDSLKIVFLFKTPSDAALFYSALLKDKDFSLNVMKYDEGNYSFFLKSSNSPNIIEIHTSRTDENNPQIKMLSDTNYKDYTYLTCGYKELESQLVHSLKDSVPAF